MALALLCALAAATGSAQAPLTRPGTAGTVLGDLHLCGVALRLLIGDVHLRLEDPVNRLASILADVGDRVMGARRIVSHVAIPAAAIAATREPRHVASTSTV